MTQVMEGFQTFVSSDTYTISTDEPEAQHLTREMLDNFIHSVSSATSSVDVTIRSPFRHEYRRQEEVWPSFEPFVMSEGTTTGLQ